MGKNYINHYQLRCKFMTDSRGIQQDAQKVLVSVVGNNFPMSCASLRTLGIIIFNDL